MISVLTGFSVPIVLYYHLEARCRVVFCNMNALNRFELYVLEEDEKPCVSANTLSGRSS